MRLILKMKTINKELVARLSQLLCEAQHGDIDAIAYAVNIPNRSPTYGFVDAINPDLIDEIGNLHYELMNYYVDKEKRR